MLRIILLIFLGTISIAVADRYSHAGVATFAETQTPLLHRILEGYDRRVRPHQQTEVKFGTSLQEIISYKIEGNAHMSFVLKLWHTLRYNDARLQWDKMKYGGIKTVRLDLGDIWLPDVKLFNSLRPFTGYEGVEAVVYSNGDVLVVPSVNEEVMCTAGDDQNYKYWKCSLKYGSWTYDAHMLNLTSPSNEVDMSSYSNRISVESTACKRNEVKYPCCPEIYVDITCGLIIAGV